MAAGGWKIFTPGDVLTADDTMDYLQQGVLVFDSSGARGSAIASPVEGQFSYLKDTDSTEYYDGAAWTQVAQGGLVHIVTESFSAVSSVSLDNCFSGDYDNYLVFLNKLVCSAGVNGLMRMRASGTDATGSDYAWQTIEANGTSVSGSRSTSQSSYRVISLRTDANGSDVAVNVFRPYVASQTNIATHISYDSYAGALLSAHVGTHNISTAYDGFTFFPLSGTVTGTVSVFGYKK